MQIKEAPTASALASLFKDIVARTAGGEVLARFMTRLVGVGSDGASVMLGEHAGLIRLLRDSLALYMLSCHCAAHRVSLCSSVMTQVPLIDKVITLLKLLNTFYCKSPKRSSAYQQMAVVKGLGKVALPQRIVPTRWLSTYK